MLEAAKYIGDHYHCAVLLKGGHQINDANDLLYKEEKYQWFKGKRINNNNTHGDTSHILYITTSLYIGISAAQPCFPAFL